MPKLPDKSPQQVGGEVLCSGCGKPMAVSVQQAPKTGAIVLGGVVYHCDSCQYDFRSNDRYLQGQMSRAYTPPEKRVRKPVHGKPGAPVSAAPEAAPEAAEVEPDKPGRRQKAVA